MCFAVNRVEYQNTVETQKELKMHRLVFRSNQRYFQYLQKKAGEPEKQWK